MKFYTIPQLKTIAREQGYKLASLQDVDGHKIVSSNPFSVKIEKQLDNIALRLKADIQPDGVYNVCMANSPSKSRNPDRYPIMKGKVKPEQMSEAENKNTVIIKEKSNDVLTWDQAVEMNKQIAELTAKVGQFEFENNALKLQVSQLEAELEEEEEDDGLSDPGAGMNGLGAYIKETLPTITAILERHYDLQERKLKLDELKANVNTGKRFTKVNRQGNNIVPGTQPHLDLIEKLFNEEREEELNIELDKLEAAQPQIYAAVIQKLGLSEEEEEELEHQ